MGENGGGDAVASVVNNILNVSSGGPANVELLDRTVDSFYTAVSNEQVRFRRADIHALLRLIGSKIANQYLDNPSRVRHVGY